MRALAKVYALRGQLDSALALYERVLEVARNNLGLNSKHGAWKILQMGTFKLGDRTRPWCHSKKPSKPPEARRCESEAIALNDLGYVCEKQLGMTRLLEFYEKSSCHTKQELVT